MGKNIFQKIVVAYSGSQSSLHAVMYAIIMAKQLGCKVKVIYVANTEAIRILALEKIFIQEECESSAVELENDGKKYLEIAEKLAKSKGVKIETELRHGSIWAEIVTAADEWQANLILLGGTSGITEFNSLIHNKLSSHDSEIIGSSHCSVLVVKEQYIEQLFKLA